jgi:hypothetical protein
VILDLCVSAALDAVKERVELPWSQGSSSNGSLDSTSAVSHIDTPNEFASLLEAPTSPVQLRDSSSLSPGIQSSHSRALHPRHFTKALKEITPSSSEYLGSLADLRRWNEEFGEGRKNRKKQVWGKDRFGFTNKGDIGEEGRVALVGNPTSEVKVEQ